ncbi:MAG: hypothetical protein ACI8PZ_004706, partial [Myxococcota bacterium]
EYEDRSFPTVNGESQRMHGAGVVVEDFTGDGLLDMVMLGTRQSDYFIQREDGGYDVNVPGTFPADLDVRVAFGGAAGDYDGDGDLDLVITRYNSPDVLLNNDGSGNFADVTQDALPPLEPWTGSPDAGRLYDWHMGVAHRSSSAAWGDFDRDGDLDLLIGGHGFVREDGTHPSDFPPGEPSFLYQNNGDGTFTDMSALLPAEVHEGYTFVVSFVDGDLDGYPEIYLINDLGSAYQECRWLWNRTATGEGFVADDNRAALDVNVAGMGLAISDLNGDGYPDFLVPAWGRFRYLLSSFGGTVWIDHSDSTGLVPRAFDPYNQTVGWGTEMGDFNNDLLDDAVVVFGHIQTRVSPSSPEQPDGLWLQQADGRFVDVAQRWGVNDRGVSRGIAVGDLNNDGWLDMVKPDLVGPHLLKLSRCGEEAWLRVRLRHEGSMNRFGVHALIAVTLADGTVVTRTVRAGGTGYGSASPHEVHFGLGGHATVASLEVTWHDGEVSTFADIDTRQVLTVRRTE